MNLLDHSDIQSGGMVGVVGGPCANAAYATSAGLI